MAFSDTLQVIDAIFGCIHGTVATKSTEININS